MASQNLSMSPKLGIFVLFIGIIISSGFGGVSASEYQNNQIARGFDAKNILSSIATNLMSKGNGRYGTTGGTGMGSQVISLNVTNLLILVLLKALIFAAASLAGHKGGMGGELSSLIPKTSHLLYKMKDFFTDDHYARSVDGDGNDKLLSDEEVLMFLSYLTGTPGDNGCLQNIACQQPSQAKKYVNAGDVVLKAAKMFSVQADDTYDYVLKEVDHAANVGIAGGNCQIFKCNDASNS